MALRLFVPLGLETLASSDLDEDIDVLNTRYQQVLDAVRLPNADSFLRLLQLEENWTLDESWKNTRILRWFTPRKRGTELRRTSQNRCGAYLCLAALRKWQLNHADVRRCSPADLKQAITGIGLEQIPVDAFSGKPLLFLETEAELVIYSIGPDEVDDQARKEFDPNNETDEGGDVVFRMIKSRTK